MARDLEPVGTPGSEGPAKEDGGGLEQRAVVSGRRLEHAVPADDEHVVQGVEPVAGDGTEPPRYRRNRDAERGESSYLENEFVRSRGVSDERRRTAVGGSVSAGRALGDPSRPRTACRPRRHPFSSH